MEPVRHLVGQVVFARATSLARSRPVRADIATFWPYAGFQEGRFVPCRVVLGSLEDPGQSLLAITERGRNPVSMSRPGHLTTKMTTYETGKRCSTRDDSGGGHML